LKLFGAFLLVTAGFAAGSLAAKAKKDTLDRMEAVAGLISHLLRRIESSNTLLFDAINEYKSDMLKKCGFYTAFDGGRTSVNRAWQNAVYTLSLPPEANAVLLSLGDGFGLMCREKQLEALKRTQSGLETLISAAAEKLAKISRCYGLLGALAGLLAAILIA